MCSAKTVTYEQVANGDNDVKCESELTSNAKLNLSVYDNTEQLELFIDSSMKQTLDIRKILVKEGLKAEESRECMLLRQEVEDLKQHIRLLEDRHFVEREEIAKAYILESEKTEKLEDKLITIEIQLCGVQDRKLFCEQQRDEFKRKWVQVERERKILLSEVDKLKILNKMVEIKRSHQLSPPPTITATLDNVKPPSSFFVPLGAGLILPTPPLAPKDNRSSRYVRKMGQLKTALPKAIDGDTTTIPRFIRRKAPLPSLYHRAQKELS